MRPLLQPVSFGACINESAPRRHSPLHSSRRRSLTGTARDSRPAPTRKMPTAASRLPVSLPLQRPAMSGYSDSLRARVRLVAGRTDDAQRADFQFAAGELSGGGDAMPDVGSQRLPVGRFDKNHRCRSLLEEARAPTAGLWRVRALDVAQAEGVSVSADFETAGDGHGCRYDDSCRSCRGRSRRFWRSRRWGGVVVFGWIGSCLRGGDRCK